MNKNILKKAYKIYKEKGSKELLCAVWDNLKGNRSNYKEVSYSQCGEDRIVSYLLKMIAGNTGGVNYLDIGCNHPYRLNNTALLRETFPIYKGVLVEPNPELYKLIKKKRKRDIVVNAGIGIKRGKLPYYMLNVNTLNTFSKEEAEQAVSKGYQIERHMEIEVLEINAVLKRYFPDGKLEFMSVDTEGGDYDLLRKIDYEFIRPAVICVETLEFMAGKDKEVFALIDFFKQKEYMLYADTWINTIFVDKRRMERGCANSLFS